MADEQILHAQRLMKLENIFQGECNGKLDDACKSAISVFNQQCDELAVELGQFDERSEKNIRSLRLMTQREARLFLGRIRDAGLERSGYQVKIICGTRTYPEQGALYAKGRTKPGRKVTKKKPGESFHNFGLAWDIGVFSNSGAYLTDKKLYKKVGQAGSAKNLVWGGGHWRFLFFPDYPHYQLDNATRTGIVKLRESFEQGTECPLL